MKIRSLNLLEFLYFIFVENWFSLQIIGSILLFLFASGINCFAFIKIVFPYFNITPNQFENQKDDNRTPEKSGFSYKNQLN